MRVGIMVETKRRKGGKVRREGRKMEKGGKENRGRLYRMGFRGGCRRPWICL